MLETETKYIMGWLIQAFRELPGCERGITIRMYQLASATVPLILINEHKKIEDFEHPLDRRQLIAIIDYVMEPLIGLYSESFPTVQITHGSNM